jgi:beta-lactam-binding protein with PASTA domain
MIYKDLPSVIGMSVDEAERVLQNAGFEVNVGSAVDSSEGKGIVVRQSPGAGRVAGGTSVTIHPSNGQGVTIPGGLVGAPYQEARNTLMSAGFGNVDIQCQEQEGGSGLVASVSPGEGTEANRNTRVALVYTDDRCRGGGQRP